MKKIFLFISVCLAGFVAEAQNYESIKTMIILMQYKKAKEELDKAMTVAKFTSKPEAYILKASVYAGLATDPAFKGTAAGDQLVSDADAAFTKYKEMDPSMALVTDPVYQSATINIYSVLFSSGYKDYDTKNWAAGFQKFKKVVEYSDLFINKKIIQIAADTNSILLAGITAESAGQKDEAVKYYGRIADMKAGGEGFQGIYQFLVGYYTDKDDQVNKNKYLALQKQLYPTSDYGCDAELKEAGEDQKKRFAKYDKLISGSCGTFTISYNYAAEIFNYLYTGDQRPANYVVMQAKLESVIKKVFSLKNGPEANLLMARHLYNMAFDIQDSITAVKGTKPDDIKKKVALRSLMNKKYDELLPYAAAVENLYNGKTGLKTKEKVDLKVALNMLLSYWENKKDQAKINEYADKMKALDNN